MNRRHLLIAALSAPVLAMPKWAFAANRRVIWEAGTLDSPHAVMIGRYIEQMIRDRIVYTTGDEMGFGYFVKLEDPRFRVLMGKPVWNWMTGFTDEQAPIVSICEGDVHLGNVGIATSIGYEKYWSYRHERDMERHPDYFVRRLHMTYDRLKLIEPDLPKDHTGLDMRWLEATIKRENAA
jgi:hypothetical protein